MKVLHNTEFYSKVSFELIRKFISEEEEQILLNEYGIEFVSYDQYETLNELLETWKAELLKLGVRYAQRENDPVFNPLKKYYNTFLRDIIIRMGIPEFNKDEVGTFYQRYHYENVFLPELCSDVRKLFVEDLSHPYLYNFTDEGSSKSVYQYLDDNRLRSDIVDIAKKAMKTSLRDFSNILNDVNQKKREESGDEYLQGLFEKSWTHDFDRILCVVFNPYIQESYEKNKKFNKDISDGLAASIELLRPLDNPRTKALVEAYDQKNSTT